MAPQNCAPSKTGRVNLFLFAHDVFGEFAGPAVHQDRDQYERECHREGEAKEDRVGERAPETRGLREGDHADHGGDRREEDGPEP